MAGVFYNFDATIQGLFQAAIREAFDRWETVANIDFQEVSDTSNVDIRLGWDAIDGPSGTLGEATYSYINGTTITNAEIVFDPTENWSLDPNGAGIYFLAVALHEIGHAIGLKHANGSIMAAFIDPNVDDLTPSDIQGIQLLYGAATPAAGTPGNDAFYGTSGANSYDGGNGNDIIFGRGGNDTLIGGWGNDQIYGEGDHDSLYGGGGNDFIVGGSGDDTIVTSYYFATSYSGFSGVYGGDGNDIIVSNGVDQVFGDAGNDTVYANVTMGGYAYIDGGTGNDVLSGSNGGDTILGRDNNDYLFGWAGNDKLDGGQGNDVLYGGAGFDQFTGGAGSDIFQLSLDMEAGVMDQVIDFTAGSDFFVLPQAYQGQVHVLDTPNGVFIAALVNGGWWGTMVYGTHDVGAVNNSIWYF